MMLWSANVLPSVTTFMFIKVPSIGLHLLKHLLYGFVVVISIGMGGGGAEVSLPNLRHYMDLVG